MIELLNQVVEQHWRNDILVEDDKGLLLLRDQALYKASESEEHFQMLQRVLKRNGLHKRFEAILQEIMDRKVDEFFEGLIDIVKAQGWKGIWIKINEHCSLRNDVIRIAKPSWQLKYNYSQGSLKIEKINIIWLYLNAPYSLQLPHSLVLEIKQKLMDRLLGGL